MSSCVSCSPTPSALAAFPAKLGGLCFPCLSSFSLRVERDLDDSNSSSIGGSLSQRGNCINWVFINSESWDHVEWICIQFCQFCEFRGFPGGPVVKTLRFHCRGLEFWIRSLVGELRSHMPQGTDTHTQKERIKYCRVGPV